MTAAIPSLWRAIVFEINGSRIPDGEPGIRDVDAPCETFEPTGKPFELADGSGDCSTDGHYICSECKHIERGELRRRQDRCEDTGAKLALCTCQECRRAEAANVRRAPS